MSLSKSIPVFSPIASSKKTKSSVTILPLAPGAAGHPPIPPIDESMVVSPTSTAAKTFANPCPLILDQGYYISHGERDPDIAGITVPILGRDSELIGVISLSGLTTRFTDDNIESFLEALMSISNKVCLAFGRK